MQAPVSPIQYGALYEVWGRVTSSFREVLSQGPANTDVRFSDVKESGPNPAKPNEMNIVMSGLRETSLEDLNRACEQTGIEGIKMSQNVSTEGENKWWIRVPIMEAVAAVESHGEGGVAASSTVGGKNVKHIFFLRCILCTVMMVVFAWLFVPWEDKLSSFYSTFPGVRSLVAHYIIGPNTQ